MTKETKALLLFFITYTIINVALWFSSQNPELEFRAILYVILYYPVFWIVSGIILICMIRLLKIRINSNSRILLVLFSTPLPFIVLYAIWATW